MGISLCNGLCPPLVVDHHSRIRVWLRDGESLFPQEDNMFLHTPPGLRQAILDGVSDASEACQIRRIKSEETRISSCLNIT